jgi:PilZ domain
VEERLNRRGTLRRNLRFKPRVECRKGTQGIGRNLAVECLDISQTGASLLVTQELPAETEVEVCLTSHGRPKPVRTAALVIRCIPAEEGKYTLSVRFERPLDYATFQQVT